MKRIFSALSTFSLASAFLALQLAAMPIAHAEKADSEKPTNIEADQFTMDDVKQVKTFTGNVIMTRGSMKMTGAKVVVTTDPAGYQFAVLYAAPGDFAKFSQKRDSDPNVASPPNLWIDGQAADRIEYDDKTEIAKLYKDAQMRRLELPKGATMADVKPQDIKVTDKVNGQFILYDSRAEFYSVNNTVDGVSKPGAGRITAVLQPKPKQP
ncbi:lipopolysaccharide transport periplasmic protein LptA [Glaciimonas soli]|uniref:Lipopolysaccharide export system protein LptA n=1 Tax=Glaciimonas soli TaxID=2590999 RepID=A0A843YY20_9BURK|nr:lipopolysaccharide transport periplasmic protein LptA [Glaciimonas soli]MQR02673.1 lipopolysaccharide transport periplasmic protein LptA [Glaciimonas soli]